MDLSPVLIVSERRIEEYRCSIDSFTLYMSRADGYEKAARLEMLSSESDIRFISNGRSPWTAPFSFCV
jgi:hypothetical protein